MKENRSKKNCCFVPDESYCYYCRKPRCLNDCDGDSEEDGKNEKISLPDSCACEQFGFWEVNEGFLPLIEPSSSSPDNKAKAALNQ